MVAVAGTAGLSKKKENGTRSGSVLRRVSKKKKQHQVLEEKKSRHSTLSLLNDWHNGALELQQSLQYIGTKKRVKSQIRTEREACHTRGSRQRLNPDPIRLNVFKMGSGERTYRRGGSVRFLFFWYKNILGRRLQDLREAHKILG